MTLDSASVISIEGDSEKVCFGTTDGRLIVRDARSQSFRNTACPKKHAHHNTQTTERRDERHPNRHRIGRVASFRRHRFPATGPMRHRIHQKSRPTVTVLIWVGPAGQGLYKYDPATGLTRFSRRGTRENLTGKNNSRVSEHNSQTWITLNGGGIMWYDRETDRAYPLLDEQNTQVFRPEAPALPIVSTEATICGSRPPTEVSPAFDSSTPKYTCCHCTAHGRAECFSSTKTTDFG